MIKHRPNYFLILTNTIPIPTVCITMAEKQGSPIVLLPLEDSSVEIVEQAILTNILSTTDYRIRECQTWLDWAAKRQRVDLFRRLNPTLTVLQKYRDDIRHIMVSSVGLHKKLFSLLFTAVSQLFLSLRVYCRQYSNPNP